MRRSAPTLVICLPALFLVPGCKSAAKVAMDGQTPATMADPYAATTVDSYDQPARSYESMAAETMSTDFAGTDTAYATTLAALSRTRYHTVIKKDTLFGLARMYYNDASRWKDIYAANRTDLGDPNRIRIGQRLVIP